MESQANSKRIKDGVSNVAFWRTELPKLRDELLRMKQTHGFGLPVWMAVVHSNIDCESGWPPETERKFLRALYSWRVSEDFRFDERTSPFRYLAEGKNKAFRRWWIGSVFGCDSPTVAAIWSNKTDRAHRTQMQKQERKVYDYFSEYEALASRLQTVLGKCKFGIEGLEMTGIGLPGGAGFWWRIFFDLVFAGHVQGGIGLVDLGSERTANGFDVLDGLTRASEIRVVEVSDIVNGTIEAISVIESVSSSPDPVHNDDSGEKQKGFHDVPKRKRGTWVQEAVALKEGDPNLQDKEIREMLGIPNASTMSSNLAWKKERERIETTYKMSMTLENAIAQGLRPKRNEPN